MTNFVRDGELLIVNAETGGAQALPEVVMLENGNFVFVWGVADDILARLYSADLQPIGDDFIVSTSSNQVLLPDITALAGGGFVVSWQTNDPAQDGVKSAIKARVFDENAGLIGEEILVNTQFRNIQTGPSVSALLDGGFVIAWQTFDYIKDRGHPIKAQIFDESGRKVQGEFAVAQSSIPRGAPEVTTLTNGNFVVTGSMPDGDLEGITFKIFDPGGGAISDPIVINTETVGEQYLPEIAALPNGGFIVSWTSAGRVEGSDYGNIKARIFDSAGAPIGSEFLVNGESAGQQIAPSIAVLANGDFVVTWKNDAREGSTLYYDSYARVFSEAGVPYGDDIFLGPRTSSSKAAALPDGGFVVTWSSREGRSAEELSDIFAAVYRPAPSGGPIDGTPDADVLEGTPDDDVINGLGGDDELLGLGGDDELNGGLGDDILRGGTGDDAMAGGSGNDAYYVNEAGDQVSETADGGGDAGGNRDLVYSAVSFVLPEFVENIELLGAAAIDATGNGLDNRITGNAGRNVLSGEGGNDRILGQGAADTLNGGDGNDKLNGGGGDDMMAGGAGNDFYYVAQAGDVVSEADGGGTDTVQSTVDYTLSAFVEDLLLVGPAALAGSGNGIANRLVGNELANVLQGGGGDDRLFGNQGDDELFGEAGDDRIEGGEGDDLLSGSAGLDTLFGQGGADHFLLAGPAAGGVAAVKDFSRPEGDRLLVTGADYGLAAGALDPARFSGSGAATSPAGTGQFVFDKTARTLSWDADGSGAGVATLIATLNTSILTAADLLVV